MSQENTHAGIVCCRCGARFGCDVAAGKSHCWCMDESGVALPLPPPGSDARCMCRACLRSVNAQRAGVLTPF